MTHNTSHFIPDTPDITPEGVITDMIRDGIGEVLGAHRNILYIQHRQVKVYFIEDWGVYIWSDQRGRENSIFISPEYTGGNHKISWYRNRKSVIETMIKIPNARDFIERCVLKDVTPETIN